jgi:hypothetical protein
MFFFQNLLTQALNGIDGSGMTNGILNAARVVSLICLLWGVYQAYVAGGDVRGVGLSLVKYLAVGLILLSYPQAFRDVVDLGATVANFISNQTAGGLDVIEQWKKDASVFMQTPQGTWGFWKLIGGTTAGAIYGILMLGGYVILALAYIIFTLLYTLFGSVLYTAGPFVIALLPALGVSTLARSYITNLMIFSFWAVLYAVFQGLMHVVGIDTVANVLNANSLLGFLQGVSAPLLLGLISIVYAVCIAFIPMFARRIVQGDVGAIAGGVVRTAFMIASRYRGGGPPPPPPPGGGAAVAT